MAKSWSTKFLVVLALLGCLVGTKIEAQDSRLWKKPGTPPQNPPPWNIPLQYPNPQKPGSPPIERPPQWPNPQKPGSPPIAQPPQWPNPQKPGSPPIAQPPQWPKPQKPEPQLPKPQGQQNPSTNVASNQIPKKPNIPLTQNPPVGVIKNCEVERNVRVTCGTPGISPAECEHIGCCFDGQQCYYGKPVTVQCTKDAQFIVVVAKDVTLPYVDLGTISLLGSGQGCTHVDSNSAFAIYQFPVTSCGTVFMEEPGVIIYENTMTSSYEVGVGPRGTITRDSYYNLLFQCRYTATSVEAVVANILPLQNPPLPVSDTGPIRVLMRLANGQCYTKGCNELDVAYTSFYTDADYPVTKVLREPVYVQVELLGKTDPMLVLTLGRCWVTTTPFPHSFPQWDILIDGCPYLDDNYMSSLVPVGSNSGLEFPSHVRRFLFKMFTFVGSTTQDPTKVNMAKQPLNEQLFIHCSTAVCVSGQFISCEPRCFRTKRDVEATDQNTAHPKTVVSFGPLNMTAPEQ